MGCCQVCCQAPYASDSIPVAFRVASGRTFVYVRSVVATSECPSNSATTFGDTAAPTRFVPTPCRNECGVIPGTMPFIHTSDFRTLCSSSRVPMGVENSHDAWVSHHVAARRCRVCSRDPSRSCSGVLLTGLRHVAESWWGGAGTPGATERR